LPDKEFCQKIVLCFPTTIRTTTITITTTTLRVTATAGAMCAVA
jgi:hypothetical protein